MRSKKPVSSGQKLTRNQRILARFPDWIRIPSQKIKRLKMSTPKKDLGVRNVKVSKIKYYSSDHLSKHRISQIMSNFEEATKYYPSKVRLIWLPYERVYAVFGDGNHRVKAAKLLGRPTICAHVFSLTTRVSSNKAGNSDAKDLKEVGIYAVAVIALVVAFQLSKAAGFIGIGVAALILGLYLTKTHILSIKKVLITGILVLFFASTLNLSINYFFDTEAKITRSCLTVELIWVNNPDINKGIKEACDLVSDQARGEIVPPELLLGIGAMENINMLFGEEFLDRAQILVGRNPSVGDFQIKPETARIALRYLENAGKKDLVMEITGGKEAEGLSNEELYKIITGENKFLVAAAVLRHEVYYGNGMTYEEIQTSEGQARAAAVWNGSLYYGKQVDRGVEELKKLGVTGELKITVSAKDKLETMQAADKKSVGLNIFAGLVAGCLTFFSIRKLSRARRMVRSRKGKNSHNLRPISQFIAALRYPSVAKDFLRTGSITYGIALEYLRESKETRAPPIIRHIRALFYRIASRDKDGNTHFHIPNLQDKVEDWAYQQILLHESKATEKEALLAQAEDRILVKAQQRGNANVLKLIIAGLASFGATAFGVTGLMVKPTRNQEVLARLPDWIRIPSREIKRLEMSAPKKDLGVRDVEVSQIKYYSYDHLSKDRISPIMSNFGKATKDCHSKVTLIWLPDEKVYAVFGDGNHRVKTAKLLGKRTIYAHVFTMTARYAAHRTHNLGSKGQQKGNGEGDSHNNHNQPNTPSTSRNIKVVGLIITGVVTLPIFGLGIILIWHGIKIWRSKAKAIRAPPTQEQLDELKEQTEAKYNLTLRKHDGRTDIAYVEDRQVHIDLARFYHLSRLTQESIITHEKAHLEGKGEIKAYLAQLKKPFLYTLKTVVIIGLIIGSLYLIFTGSGLPLLAGLVNFVSSNWIALVIGLPAFGAIFFTIILK
ncbi:MAG: hypothetical protein HQ547_00780, partial [Candidatus Omnitrophica bacterium]|nr:hypothetical protein [Candidatus Omnitrophota bacterium]